MDASHLRRMNIERYTRMLAEERDEARRELLRAALEREETRSLHDYPVERPRPD